MSMVTHTGVQTSPCLTPCCPQLLAAAPHHTTPLAAATCSRRSHLDTCSISSQAPAAAMFSMHLMQWGHRQQDCTASGTATSSHHQM